MTDLSHHSDGSSSQPGGVRQSILRKLASRGVDTSNWEFLTVGESESIVEHWMQLGAERYGRLALIAPPGTRVLSGTYDDGVVPGWLDRDDRSVLLLFRDYRANGLIRCRWNDVLARFAEIARSDEDGFAAVTDVLGGVLLVDVDEKLGDSMLELSAWGELVSGRPT